MTFKQIEAFRAVMLSGSMTSAARELRTFQPNISRLILQLEDETSLQLFKRLAGKLVPTDEGRMFFDEVQRSYVGLESLEASARNIKQYGTGQLRIGAAPSIAMSFLPSAIAVFSSQNPKVVVSVYTNDSRQVGYWVASHFCGLGLSSFHVDVPGVQAKPLYNIAGVCIVPKDHRIAQQETVQAEDLAGERFISLAPDDYMREKVDKVFNANGPDRRILTLDTPYAVTICKMVAMKLGVSIVNPLVAREGLPLGIAVRRFRPAIPFRSYLLLPSYRPVNLLAQRFCEILLKTVKQELASEQDL
jgi:DNA-binding transcriptional LysR family regulator